MANARILLVFCRRRLHPLAAMQVRGLPRESGPEQNPQNAVISARLNADTTRRSMQMNDDTLEMPKYAVPKSDGIFHIAFAWITALTISLAAWFGLS